MVENKEGNSELNDTIIKDLINDNFRANSGFIKEEFVKNFKSEFLRSVVMNDYKEILDFKNKYPILNKDLFQQDVFSGIWLSMYMKDHETYNFLIQNFESLKGFLHCQDIHDLEDKFEELIDFGRRFNIRLLNDSIRKKEEFLAKLIIQYDCYLTDEGLFHIIKYEMLDFLKYLIVNSKNFKIKSPSNWSHEELLTEEITNFNANLSSNENIKIEMISLKEIFNKINYILPQKREEVCEKIILWKIKTRENVLEALLSNGLDRIAIKNIHLFQSDINSELMYSSICNKNDEFIKKCMMSQYISRIIFYDKEFLSIIVNLFNYGESLELGANIINALNPITIDVFHSKKIIANISKIFMEFNKNNQLLFCNNPIMAMALISEMILVIGKRHHSLDIKCKNLFSYIQEFSYTYIDTIEDEVYYDLLMSKKDFFERMCLDIIVDNKFTKMTKDEKSGLKFLNVWEGPEFLNFDMGLDQISIIYHLVLSKLDLSKSSSAFSFISNEFNKLTSTFPLQNKYRRFYTSFYFYYDFLYNLIVLIFFQNINLTYVRIFIHGNAITTLKSSFPVMSALTLTNISNNELFMYSYQTLTFSPIWLKMTIVLVIFNLISPINRVIFVMNSKKKHRWDFNIIFDVISNLLNLINMSLIYGSLYDQSGNFNFLLNHRISYVYFITLVTCLNWIKLYYYFKCFRGTSALVETLVNIFTSTIYFLVLLLCYFLIMTTVFYILYQKLIPNLYGQFSLSLNTLFDAIVFSYTHPLIIDPIEREKYDRIYRIFFSIHVFIVGVLLVNYLVSILSLVFNETNDEEYERDFCYYSAIYYFNSRYRPGMLDKKHGNLLLFLPPFNLISTVCSVFIMSKYYEIIVKIIEFIYFFCTSLLIFLIYFIYLSILSPILMLKAFTIIFSMNLNISRKGLVFFTWIFIGPIIVIISLIRDLFNFIYILSLNYFPSETSKLQKDYEKKLYIEIFNQSKMIFSSININFKEEIHNKSLFITVPNLLHYLFKQKIDDLVYKKINKVIDYKSQNTTIKFMHTFLGKYLQIRPAGHIIKGTINSFELSLLNKKTNIKANDKTHLDISEKIEKFFNNFAIPTIKGDIINLHLMKIIFERTIHYNNINKIIDLNFKLMGNTLNKLENQNPYGILEFFESLNKNRMLKIINKVKILENNVKKIMKNHGITDFKNFTRNLKNRISFINKIETSKKKNKETSENINEDPEKSSNNFMNNLYNSVRDTTRKNKNNRVLFSEINDNKN